MLKLHDKTTFNSAFVDKLLLKPTRISFCIMF